MANEKESLFDAHAQVVRKKKVKDVGINIFLTLFGEAKPDKKVLQKTFDDLRDFAALRYQGEVRLLEEMLTKANEVWQK